MSTDSKGLNATTRFIQKLSVFVLLVVVCFVGVSFCNDKKNDTLEEESAQFDVKPGGQVNEYSREWDGFTCKFTYACQGGTKEEWVMTLKRSLNKKHYKCIVSRPSGKSYLFFQQFSAQIKGHLIKTVNLMANDGRALSPEEYKVEKSKNTVSQVDGKFKSELTLVEIKAVRQKKKKEL